jgi:hypothetical protein
MESMSQLRIAECGIRNKIGKSGTLWPFENLLIPLHPPLSKGGDVLLPLVKGGREGFGDFSFKELN